MITASGDNGVPSTSSNLCPSVEPLKQSKKTWNDGSDGIDLREKCRREAQSTQEVPTGLPELQDPKSESKHIFCMAGAGLIARSPSAMRPNPSVRDVAAMEFYATITQMLQTYRCLFRALRIGNSKTSENGRSTKEWRRLPPLCAPPLSVLMQPAHSN